MMTKIFSLTCISTILLAIVVPLTSAWSMMPTNNNNPAQDVAFSRRAAAAGILSAAVLLVMAPVATEAAVDDAFNGFTGDYADPKHPNCLRNVQVIGRKASVSGTDGTPGCPSDGSGRKWSLVGSVDSDKIFVDFSPKGGPKDLEGQWESEPVPGIRWPDGNLWSSKVSPN